jgi:hypothetical protein
MKLKSTKERPKIIIQLQPTHTKHQIRFGPYQSITLLAVPTDRVSKQLTARPDAVFAYLDY